MKSEDSSSETRRTFLKTAAVLSLGSLAFSRSASAAEPITRTGKPFLKLSLAAYSFRNSLTRGWPKPTGKPGTMTLFDFIDFCAAQDLDGVELTNYYFPNPLTTDYMLQIKQQTFRLGLNISGTAIGNDFCLPDGPERDAQLKLCRDWIDYAAFMGAPVIRIFAGRVPRNSNEEQALDRCVQGINESLKYAAEKGVVLALENHGGITATSDQLLKIVKRVDSSPWFGVNFDSANFKTENPYNDLEKIAPYAVNAQIKVSIHPTGTRTEKTDYARILQILKSAGYRGYVALEFEEPEDPFQVIPGELRKLRELIG